MTSRSHHFLALVCALAASAGAARASLTTSQAYSDLWEFDQTVGNYNLVSIGNATMNNFGDVEGGLEIGGNLTIGGAAVATKLTGTDVKNSTTPTLYVAKTLTDSSSTSIKLNNGYAALPSMSTSAYTWNTSTDLLKNKTTGATVLSEVNSSSPTADVDPRSKNPAVNFTTLQSHMSDVSTSLAAATATGTIKVVGSSLEFVAPVNSSGVVFFDLNMSLLSGNKYNGKTFSNIEIDVPTDLDFVVNVENANGKTLFGEGSGINFNSGTGDSRLLWNIEGGTAAHPGTITIGNGGAFYGSVLAADYNVYDDSNTFINGQVVADTFSGSTAGNSACDGSGTEMHMLGFNPDLPPAPEPSTYGLAGAAVLGGLVFLRRKARR